MADTKTYSYKVYNTAGTFVGVWDNDVISEFGLSEEINTSGSQLGVQLARPADDFGEGVDVEFNFKVKVYAIDGEQPNGVLVFQGYIADYTPIYGSAEHIDIVVLGYGSELNNYIIGSDEVVDQSQTTADSTEYFESDRLVAQGFLATVSPITSIDLKVQASTPRNVYVSIYPTSPGGDYPGSNPLSGATASQYVTEATETLYKFTFPASISVVTGVKYWIVVNG